MLRTADKCLEASTTKIMHLIYFDEVKDNPDNQKYFWVGGLAVDVNYIGAVENELSNISMNCFGTPCLGSLTEFHAVDIYHRKKNYKKWNDPTLRVALIGELMRTLDNDSIMKLYVKIDREYFNKKFSSKKIDEMAFMLFCEKANALMQQQQDIGMLIGDRESSSIASKYAELLSNWRSHRTEYQLGKEITNLIDTVHFTESHLSRMLQMADIHIWCRQFRSLNRNQENISQIQEMMLNKLDECGNAFFAKKYKEYPLGC